MTGLVNCPWNYYASMKFVREHDKEFIMGSPIVMNSEIFITAGVRLTLWFLNNDNPYITTMQIWFPL
jgi:hypothetical protein